MHTLVYCLWIQITRQMQEGLHCWYISISRTNSIDGLKESHYTTSGQCLRQSLCTFLASSLIKFDTDIVNIYNIHRLSRTKKAVLCSASYITYIQNALTLHWHLRQSFKWNSIYNQCCLTRIYVWQSNV